MQINQEIHRMVIIPYYNEIDRFPVDYFLAQAKEMPTTSFVLVDDGSTDELTSEIMRLLSFHRLNNVQVIILSKNLGKASALQTGFSYGLSNLAQAIGFLDADFSTSLQEINRLFDILDSTDTDAVIGSRQSSPDNYIKAEWHRFLIGKLFSFFVRYYFKINLIDTQCGAKVFRVNKVLFKSIEQPAINPWLYDLQLLIPIVRSGGTVTEIKLNYWENGPKSKVNFYNGLRAFYDLRKLKLALNQSYWKH